jgi:Tfp pilus assembly protein PilF
MGRTYLEAGEYDKALGAFETGLARQPGFVPLMLDKADVLAQQNRISDALAQYAAAEKLAPKSAEVQLRKADVLQRSKRWNDADAAYQRAIALDAKNPMAYNNLAWMIVERQGDPKKAVELAKKAVELSPNSSPLLDTLGWAQRYAGELVAAQTSLKRAIEIEPKVAGYHYHLGVVQRDLKDNAEARRSLQRALELDPKMTEAEDARKLLQQLPAG